MGFIRVKKDELRLGQVLPWSVYAEAGTLLLHKGMRLQFQHQIDMLVDVGFRHDESHDRLHILLEKKIDNPFTYLVELHEHLTHILKNLTLHTPDGPLRLNYTAQMLIRLTREFADASIGFIHRYGERPYSITHSLHTGLLASLLCHDLHLEEEQHLRVVSAALTANIGMLDLQDRLENQKQALTSEQLFQVHSHPQLSAEIIEHNVSSDAEWLEMVLQHHENLNGSGYPRQLKGEAIVQGARIIALADRYSAMVSRHVYSGVHVANRVLKELYEHKGVQLDDELIQRLVHILGVYPPGTFVRLVNGELAVITYRNTTKGKSWPMACSYRGQDDRFYIHPLKRDTNLDEYHIKAMVESENPPFTDAVIWGYETL